MNYSEEQIDMTPELFMAILKTKVNNKELLDSYAEDITAVFNEDSEGLAAELLGDIIISDYINTVLTEEITKMNLDKEINKKRIAEEDKQTEINNRILDILESTTERLDKVVTVVGHLTELTTSLQQQVKTISGMSTFFK